MTEIRNERINDGDLGAKKKKEKTKSFRDQMDEVFIKQIWMKDLKRERKLNFT